MNHALWVTWVFQSKPRRNFLVHFSAEQRIREFMESVLISKFRVKDETNYCPCASSWRWKGEDGKRKTEVEWSGKKQTKTETETETVKWNEEKTRWSLERMKTIRKWIFHQQYEKYQTSHMSLNERTNESWKTWNFCLPIYIGQITVMKTSRKAFFAVIVGLFLEFSLLQFARYR